jgi:hypothetical protein
VNRIDTTKLTPDAKADLDSLKTRIQANLTQLDVEAVTLAEVSPLLPFLSEAAGLIEARLQLADMNSERAAGIITQITKEIGEIRARLDSGLAGRNGTSLRASRVQAMRAAGAVDQLRNNLNAWFTFYNGYDPLFTWWMGLPYKHADDALRGYSVLLRDSVAAANQTSNIPAAGSRIDPAPASKVGDVPDLTEIITLPQDELTDIVQRFFRSGGGAGRGIGRAGNGNGNGNGNGGGAGTRDEKFYQDWLLALKSLDFDHLTRNAQVDYLYIKKVAELQLARMGTTLPANPPRKTDNSGIPGAARGRDGLIRDLQDELIPYSPEQLIALAEKELAYCEAEMRKAARQMGLGDDWRAALEKTKSMHVPPGAQPSMIRDLIYESIDFLRAKDLVTVPEVDAESQRMNMMTPERQLVNPFFTGGTLISVSYPTDDMEYEARLESMRGNNRPWSHATAFHETVPGHNLVGFYGSRFQGYRAPLGATGPFFGEGWAVYWELTLYDMGFDKTPEERVGALFWRMHRCARIIFSLKFHMGQWSPQEAIDFLVDRIGHERANAIAEVRRSFQGGYGPLYQAAYLLGALQLRGLRKEVVDSKQMSNRAFHDEILRQGSMPIALLRLALTKQRLTRDIPIDWKFYGDLPDK